MQGCLSQWLDWVRGGMLRPRIALSPEYWHWFHYTESSAPHQLTDSKEGSIYRNQIKLSQHIYLDLQWHAKMSGCYDSKVKMGEKSSGKESNKVCRCCTCYQLSPQLSTNKVQWKQSRKLPPWTEQERKEREKDQYKLISGQSARCNRLGHYWTSPSINKLNTWNENKK